MSNYKKLEPFKIFCCDQFDGFPFIEDTLDALTNYELLCKIVEYLNITNNNVDGIHDDQTSLQAQFTNLKNYVDNYFDDLDVQDEINNKLDAMVQDGTLTNLIKDYVDPIYQEYEQRIDDNISEIEEDVETFKTSTTNEVEAFKTLTNNNITRIENEVSSATSGSPAGVYATIADLQSADPDHSKIYVVEADGEWYFWNTATSQWKNGGVYQATMISDNEVTPRKTSFIKTNNIGYYYPVVKNGICITGNTESHSVSKVYNRYCILIPVESNTDYSLLFTPFYENNFNYFKIATLTKTIEEINQYLLSHQYISIDGSIYHEVANIKNYTTGENDKTLAIQFSNDTPIEYYELFIGHYTEQQYNNYDECLDILKFGSYNKKEVNSLILSSENKYKNYYSLNNNILTIVMNKAKYTFRKITDISNNTDTWRLYKGELIKNNNVYAKMWENADAEGPIKISGEDDYVSGYHGDEEMTDLKILVDGKVIDHTSTINNTYFNNITIVCKSNVNHYRASSKAGEIAFERVKKLIFKDKTVNIYNEFTVKDTDGFRINRACAGLYQCSKNDNNSNKLINYLDSDKNLKLYEVEDEAIDVPRVKNKGFYYINDCVVSIKNIKDYELGTFNPFFLDYTSQHRVKLYFINENFDVVYNQVLSSEFEFTIE